MFSICNRVDILSHSTEEQQTVRHTRSNLNSKRIYRSAENSFVTVDVRYGNPVNYIELWRKVLNMHRVEVLSHGAEEQQTVRHMRSNLNSKLS